MRMHSTTPEDSMEALAEYEKMNDSGSANTYRKAHMKVDEISPNFSP